MPRKGQISTKFKKPGAFGQEQNPIKRTKRLLAKLEQERNRLEEEAKPQLMNAMRKHSMGLNLSPAEETSLNEVTARLNKVENRLSGLKPLVGETEQRIWRENKKQSRAKPIIAQIQQIDREISGIKYGSVPLAFRLSAKEKAQKLQGLEAQKSALQKKLAEIFSR